MFVVTTETPSLPGVHVIAFAVACAVGLLVGVATGRVFATQMSPRVVETQYGKLRGVLVTLSNRNLPQVESYLGIQYASLLGGELRFMPPTSTDEKWDGVRVAMNYRPVCPQRLPSVEELEGVMSRSRVEHFLRIYPFLERQREDCLNLNIYVPLRDKADSSLHPPPPTPSSPHPPPQQQLLFPVLIFVHGETYETGTGNAYDACALAAYGQIIVITLNYRLGALGFLSTGDGHAPGNYALLDLVAALRWTHENIRAFGGNASDVTLLGHGHGAVMVNLLLLSPLTKVRRLFHRVILQSGSALSPWALVDDPLRPTRHLSDRLNCSSHWGHSLPLLQCLKETPFQDLIRASPSPSSLFPAFGPTADNRSVLSTDARSLLTSRASESAFKDVTLLVGFVVGEGASHLNQSTLTGPGLDLDTLRSSVAEVVRGVFRNNRQTILEILMHQYRDWERPSDPRSNRASLAELLGDALYAGPALELALHHVASAGPGRTFVYCYNYSQGQGQVEGSFPGHGTDLVNLFGAPITDGVDPFESSYGKSEKAFAEVYIKYLTQFIRSGSPNAPTYLQQSGRPKVTGGRSAVHTDQVEWPDFDANRQELLFLDARPHVRRQYSASRLSLWLNLLPKIHRATDLDACYHLLRGHSSTDSATDALPPHAPVFSTPGACDRLTIGHTTTTPTASNATLTRRLTSTLHTEVTSRRTSGGDPRPDKYARGSSSPLATGSTVGVTTSKPPHPAPALTTDHRLSLCVVIATGCLLLLLNVLMLSCVYCRKANAQEGHDKDKIDVRGQTGLNRIPNNSSRDRFTPVQPRAPLLPTIASSSPPPLPILPLASSPTAVATLPRVSVGVMTPISSNQLRPLCESKTKPFTVPNTARMDGMGNNHSVAEMTED